jgi:small subunit ribosomal protein S16
MALKIRLARGGVKKRPFYRLVVAENTASRDGRFIERLGSYNPLLEKSDTARFVVNEERVKYWLSIGAKPSDRVDKLLAEVKITEKAAVRNTPKKSAPKEKAQKRLQEASEAKAENAPSEA